MLKGTIIFVMILLFGAVSMGNAFAQTVTRTHPLRLTLPLISLLDVEPQGTAISLLVGQPLDAGMPLPVTSNNTKWLNYTSCVAAATPSRTVTAKLTGALPAGIGLQLTVSPKSGFGQGVFGTSVGTLTLTTVATTILSGIRGCYTGNGINNGHQMTYTLLINNYASLTAGTSGALVVTYTISN